MKKRLHYLILALTLLSLLSACGSDTISVMDKNGSFVEVNADGSDSYSFKLSSDEEKTMEDVWDNPFIDVTEGAWYYDAIRYCYCNNLMRGTTQNTFSPYQMTSRAMIAATLWRMEGSPFVSGQNPFDDVSETQYYADAVTWAAQKGIVDGYSENLFGPDDPVTREQMAAIFYRYAAYRDYLNGEQDSLSRFTDAQDASEYAKDALSWAVANKVLNGMDEHTLDPRGNATRAQVAAILMFFCENIVEK